MQISKLITAYIHLLMIMRKSMERLETLMNLQVVMEHSIGNPCFMIGLRPYV
jgi:hypothetical protein